MEYFDVLDETGAPTGVQKLRERVHRDGDWHRSVHVWVLNNSGQLLLQKRAADKDSNPNLWDVSAAGHIGAGDASLPAALRETCEELGLELQPAEVEYLFTVMQSALDASGSFVDNEFQDVYLVHTSLPLHQFVFQREEISELRWVDIVELERMVQLADPLLVPHPAEYPLVFERLRQVA